MDEILDVISRDDGGCLENEDLENNDPENDDLVNQFW